MDEFFFLLEKIGLEGIRWWRHNTNGRPTFSLHTDVKRELDRYRIDEPQLPELLKKRKQDQVVLIPLETNHLGTISFLRPLWDLDRPGQFRPSLQLWTARSGAPEVVGMRFEFADGNQGTHVYPHVQMTTEFDDGCQLPQCCCHALTVTYPAVPLPVRDPLDLLLTVYVAVRGYRDHSESRLQQMLKIGKDRPLLTSIMERLPRIAIDVDA